MPGEVLLKISRRPYGVLVGSTRIKWHRPGTVRCPDGARQAFAHIGRAPDDFCLKFISYDSNSACPGTVRCPAGHRSMSDKRRELSNISLQIVRCPSGHRTMPSRHRSMFYESNCHRWAATCFCRKTYCIYRHISFLKTKSINIDNIFRLSS